MELTQFKHKNIGEILNWVHSESQMVQWAGPIFDWPLTQKQFRRHLEATKATPQTLYPFGLYHRMRIIGYCELSAHSRRSNSAIASRIIISPRKRGKGIGRLMVNKLLQFGFEELELNRIGLGVFDFNKPAINCYKKAGFVHEGTWRQATIVRQTYWNCHFMSILKKELTIKHKIG